MAFTRFFARRTRTTAASNDTRANGFGLLGGLLIAGVAATPVPAFAGDPGKHACFEDAKRLCPAEMNALSRSRVRACMIVHLEQTSPQCHTYMIAERDAAMHAKKTEPSPQWLQRACSA